LPLGHATDANGAGVAGFQGKRGWTGGGGGGGDGGFLSVPRTCFGGFCVSIKYAASEPRGLEFKEYCCGAAGISWLLLLGTVSYLADALFKFRFRNGAS
jgi:hypothetical protein